MKVTWDAALQVREAVKRHLGRKVFVVAVLMQNPANFPDMEPDPDIELRAENDRVKVLFGTDNLVEHLVNLVGDEEIFNPPTAWLVDEIAEALMPFLASNAQVSLPVEKPEEEADVHELNVSGRPAEVRHADVVNVYQAPVTINYYYYAAAPDADDSEEEVPTG